MIKGVLFDYDGTLAKTMFKHYKAWKYALKEFNIDIKKKDYYLLEGNSLSSLPELITKKKISKNKIDNLVLIKKKKFKEDINKTYYYKNTLNILSYLKKNKIKIGLVTSSHYDQILKSSNRKFLNIFDTIITGENTIRNKPFPDPYILGLKKLRLEKKECIVVENAPIGITSSKSAGILTLAITNTLTKNHLIKADYIIDNLLEIKEFI